MCPRCPPVITTSSASDISYYNARVSITYSHSIPFSKIGICYSTIPSPTIKNNQGMASDYGNFSGENSAIFSLRSLSPKTTYYARAFAIDNYATAYGNEISFITTSDSILNPVIVTSSISSITTTSAICGGTISSEGGSSIIARGICWSVTPNPTILNNHTSNGTGTGSFSSTLSGLTQNTIYYVRAYAINSTDTAYGSQVSFTTNPISLPTVTTIAVTNIAQATASSGGNVTSEGGASVTTRGVCWSTSQNPIVTGAHTTDGSSTGIFSSSLSGLTINITYYVRAYATNSIGTAYGNQVSFTTIPISFPTLTTNPVTNIAQTTASSGGNVTNDGGVSVTARGVCWSTSQNPVATGSHTADGSGTGSFASSITSLVLGTTYYLRAYATNSIGTAYGNQVIFTTASHAIGDSYQGGIIAYILQPGDPGYNASVQHGLIAAPSDQSTGKFWHVTNNGLTGATGTAIGTGNANTNAIIALYGTEINAAKLCANLVLGGYSDWYLPSKDELNKLYINRVVIGGFVSEGYWSSSEYSANDAWEQFFNDGSQYNVSKYYNQKVRCVRSF